MCNMRSPENSAWMIDTMQPVIHEILKYKQGYPIKQWVLNRSSKAMIIKEWKDDANINNTEHYIKAGIQYHQVNILQCILPGIAFLFAQMTEQKFQPYYNKVEWGGDEDQQLFSCSSHISEDKNTVKVKIVIRVK